MSEGLGADFQEIASAARATGRLALDTEFMGEGRYRTLLCLVQLAVPAEAMAAPVALFDPLREDLDGGPLAELLADPAIELVVHAGRQDIALLRRRFGGEVRNVFDTQIAAGFIGMPAQASYDLLNTQLLGLRLAKSASFTRWDRRPLSPEQLGYAREDVLHLLELADALQQRLERVGRLDWARQECEPLEQASDERDPQAIYLRLPRVRSLKGTSQGAARALVEWRERTAAERDRPVQSVLGDAALLEIARRMPTSTSQLQAIRGVNPTSLRRGGSDLLEVLATGALLPSETLADGPRPPLPEPGDAPLVSLAESLVRARARRAELAYELIASRADLQAIVAAHRLGGEAEVRTLQGWRRELVGEQLLRLLDGGVSLSVAGGAISVAQ